MKWKYQLVLQFPYSTQTDYDSMIAIEDQLIAELGNSALVDGHDAGADEMNIFIHTNEPEHVFKRIQSSHGSDPEFFRIKAAYRGFGTDNFIVLWPKGFKGIFRIA